MHLSSSNSTPHSTSYPSSTMSSKPEIVMEDSQIEPPKKKKRCLISNCDVCENSTAYSQTFMWKQGWKWRLAVILACLDKSSGKRGNWYSLQNDVYPFVEAHAVTLFPVDNPDFKTDWKKKVQDCFSHHRAIFQSGSATIGRKGFWRLLPSYEDDILKSVKSSKSPDCVDKSPDFKPSPSSSPVQSPVTVDNSTLSPRPTPSFIPAFSSLPTSIHTQHVVSSVTEKNGTNGTQTFIQNSTLFVSHSISQNFQGSTSTVNNSANISRDVSRETTDNNKGLTNHTIDIGHSNSSPVNWKIITGSNIRKRKMNSETTANCKTNGQTVMSINNLLSD